MMFPFVARFIDRATACTGEDPMTRVHTSYPMLARKLMGKDGRCGLDQWKIAELHREVKEFKCFVVKVLKYNVNTDCTL